MEPLFDLAISLPEHGSGGLLRGLYRQLRAAILDGRLQPGVRLPATRRLAAALKVSRNTVVAAYDLLLSEGYLRVSPGSGTYVAQLVQPISQDVWQASADQSDQRLNPFWRESPAIFSPPPMVAPRYDFRLGLPDKSAFPFPVWRRLSARALRVLSKQPAVYAEPEGRIALRAAISQHVSYARAVACLAENVIVTAGAQQAFDLLARILVTPGQTLVAVEEPGYPPLRAAFAAAGANIIGIPVDDEGLRVECLPDEARIIYVTPSHQCPLGVTLSARRRAALLSFAQRRGAVVLEDDYDGEFRFNNRPLDALQTLDSGGRVFYIGTFSKSLFPALRLGFVVTPPWARPALAAAKAHADWHSAVLAQDTLAAFITDGHLARHVRKMRKIYGERRAALVNALDRHCGESLRVLGAEAGLHLAAELTVPLAADTVVEQLALAGVYLQPLSRYAAGQVTINGLAFGYGMIPVELIEAGVARLARKLRGMG